MTDYLAEIKEALSKTTLEITEVNLSEVSKNIVVSYRISKIDRNHYLWDAITILNAIKLLDNKGYGVYIDAHLINGMTLITQSVSNEYLYNAPWDKVDNLFILEALSSHLSIPSKIIDGWVLP